MPINHEEIIEDFEGHIRKFGGGFGEWCVGTAKDSRGPFFRRHLAADLGDGLIYREAFTTSAADQVIDHLVSACGLRPDHDSVPAPGKIVFVYRKTRDTGYGAGEKVSGIRCQVSGAEPRMVVGDSGERGDAHGAPQPAPATLSSDQALLHKLAA
ncbi:MAG: hypothetical protein ABSF45_27575 [Terriglobia bacterium]|jgi:hypothetical protein